MRIVTQGIVVAGTLAAVLAPTAAQAASPAITATLGTYGAGRGDFKESVHHPQA